MANLEFHQFPYLSDNYGVLVHSPQKGETACIDAGCAKETLSALSHKGWKLTHLFITHHHADHTAGLQEIKGSTGCTVIGPRKQSSPIASIDQPVSEGDPLAFAGHEIQVLYTPGHTTDMINYYFPTEKVLFAGDTLFTLGCGKLFEGTPEMMWQSLGKLMTLPPETTMYCSHEYTLENAAFAIQVDPGNSDLQSRIQRDEKRRSDNQPTVPSTIAEELATNPFLRADSEAIRANLGMQDATDLAVFTELRKRRG